MNEKPAIVIIMSASARADLVRPVLWGIEEEGIPFEIRAAENGSIRQFAKQAADSSPLNVGIGLGDGEVVLHHRDLPAAAPLFTLDATTARSADLRCLGGNAARLVKGQPLVLHDDGRLGPVRGTAAEHDQDRIEELAALVLEEIGKGQLR